MPRASSLEAELKKATDAEVELIAGDGGVYEITADGTMIFAKSKKGRFPEPGEILSLVKELG